MAELVLAFPPFLCVICVCISVACLVCRKKTTSEGCIYKLPCHNQHVPPPNPAYPTPAYAQPPAYPACLQQQPLNPHPAQQQQYGSYTPNPYPEDQLREPLAGWKN